MTTSSIPSSPVEFLELQRVAEAKERGFALFAVKADGDTPAFVYSIGMQQHELPEILCFLTPGMESATLGLVTNICTTLIEAVGRFGRIPTLRAFCNKQIEAKDPAVTYHPTFVKGEEYLYALKAYITRAVRYREEFGMPQVIELRHDSVPNLGQICAQQMFNA